MLELRILGWSALTIALLIIAIVYISKKWGEKTVNEQLLKETDKKKEEIKESEQTITEYIKELPEDKLDELI